MRESTASSSSLSASLSHTCACAALSLIYSREESNRSGRRRREKWRLCRTRKRWSEERFSFSFCLTERICTLSLLSLSILYHRTLSSGLVYVLFPLLLLSFPPLEARVLVGVIKAERGESICMDLLHTISLP